jgi:hypothetical protein
MRARILAGIVIVAAAAAAAAVFFLLGADGPPAGPGPRTTIEQSLAALVRERFGTPYVGRCPQELPPHGDLPRGMCSMRFSGSARRAVYGVGPPFSEWIGEAALVRRPSGSWRVVRFEEYPPLGAAPPAWEGAGTPNESGAIPVVAFNEYVDATDPGWAESPARIALEFLDLGDPSDPDGGAFTVTVLQEANPEGGDRAEVTVTLEGLLDDSVQAVRYVLRFQKAGDGTWTLASAVWAQRCAPGRSHQDFGLEPCI